MGMRALDGYMHQTESSSMTAAVAAASYGEVTEQPGQPASRSQLEMLEARYAWAAELARGKDVLETACGAGMGLQTLGNAARSVQAGDVDRENLRVAGAACAGRSNIMLRQFQGEALPFPDECFDLVLLFEAIYYLADAGQFLKEARRVLRPRGALLIVTVNPEWMGFNPSPLKTRYWSAMDLLAALQARGFAARVQGAFPATSGVIRRAAVALNLIPRTMRSKALLKRIFCGPMHAVPRIVGNSSLRPSLEELDGTGSRRHRVLYATALKESL
jgi:ubiquinone/menaquinone biosynthesis C-methylase UbiE